MLLKALQKPALFSAKVHYILYFIFPIVYGE